MLKSELGRGVSSCSVPAWRRVAWLSWEQTFRQQLRQPSRPRLRGAGGQRLSCICTAPKTLEPTGAAPRTCGHLGTWVGKGFTLISLPDFDNPQGPQPFRLKLNATRETLEFQQIGGNVPNRDSKGQNDINIFGLTYLQRISDSLSSGALHIEPGLWLHVPSTTVPQPATVVRQGSIPHGTSILAQGAVIPTVNGGPKIQAVDSTPFDDKGRITSATYLAPFGAATLPPGFLPPFLKNPNLALEDAILGQNIVKTEVLLISTKTSSRAVLYRRWGAEHPPLSRSFLLSFRE